MNDLITKEVQMTSIEFSKITGKQHKNILRDIRHEEVLTGQKLIPKKRKLVNLTI